MIRDMLNPLLTKNSVRFKIHLIITDTKATMSIADELSKLAKLKEQGVITEEEFLQIEEQVLMKNT